MLASDQIKSKATTALRVYERVMSCIQGEEADGGQEGCKICGRRYHHEHVQAVRKGNQQSGYNSD